MVPGPLAADAGMSAKLLEHVPSTGGSCQALSPAPGWRRAARRRAVVAAGHQAGGQAAAQGDEMQAPVRVAITAAGLKRPHAGERASQNQAILGVGVEDLDGLAGHRGRVARLDAELPGMFGGRLTDSH